MLVCFGAGTYLWDVLLDFIFKPLTQDTDRLQEMANGRTCWWETSSHFGWTQLECNWS